MTLPHIDRDPIHGCAVCVTHRLDGPDAAVRIGPARLALGVVRAAAAVATAGISAQLSPDPIDLQPRVLRRA